jgi:CBS domain containing-hemolysin-like protein
MTALFLIILITCAISFCCSVMEGFILSVTTAELENLKQKAPSAGAELERYKNELDGTTAAILTLNTIANVVGSALAGWLAGVIFGKVGLGILTAVLTAVVLLFCEILPKNIGVMYRKSLVRKMIWALRITRVLMGPFVIFARFFIRRVLPRPRAISDAEHEAEVMTLINKGTREGVFSVTERTLIANTFELDDKKVFEIMTPLAKVVAFDGAERLASLLRRIDRVEFSRFPVFEGGRILGVVEREEILGAGAGDKFEMEVRELARPVMFVPEGMPLADLLNNFLKNRQEFAMVEGESSQTLGVVTMTDIMEHLFGRRRA